MLSYKVRKFMRSPNWIEQADQAMIRAATRARAIAAATNTPIYYMEEGKIVNFMPGAENSSSKESIPTIDGNQQ